MTSAALEGLRVIDAATLAAAPLVATALGEFGAEVIKVEQPGTGDPMRNWGDQRDGVGLVWKSLARNKKSVTLDLRQHAGQDMMHDLIRRSDVLIVNARPSALTRWRIDWDTVHEINPKLVMLHISGYGAGGPRADKPGFGTLAEAMSGFAHLTGSPDGAPTLPQFMLADGVASQTAAWAVLTALYHRDVHDGPGQHIDISLIEPLARLTEAATLTFDQLGHSPGRVGNRWDTSAPRNAYPTNDGHYIAMSAGAPSIIERVFRAIGRIDLAEHPDYTHPVRKLQHADEIDKVVGDWIAQRSLAEATAIFDEFDVAAAPVYDAEGLLNDAHLQARGSYVATPDPQLGRIRVQAPVPRLSETPGAIDHLGPELGAHNTEIYRDLLGLDQARYDELRAAGVI